MLLVSRKDFEMIVMMIVMMKGIAEGDDYHSIAFLSVNYRLRDLH